MPKEIFVAQANNLFLSIIEKNSHSGSFEITMTEKFLKNIRVTKLKASSSDKSDIKMQIEDINTGFSPIVGFSIKSQLGSPATLLNAGRTTNFTFKLKHINHIDADKINTIETREKIFDRMKAIKNLGTEFEFVQCDNKIFSENLQMIDSNMAELMSKFLLAHFEGFGNTLSDVLNYIITSDNLGKMSKFYGYKIKEFLCAVALGMNPASEWDGVDEATGGYIVVKKDGEIVAYHIYNRDKFKEYLLQNTKFERASISRHDYMRIYEENGEFFIKLNLQIRFI